MVTFSVLPIEIQRECARHFDIQTLKQFRLSSRKASSIALEYLFHTIVLNFNDESAKRFNHVLDDGALKKMVRRAIVDGRDGHQDELYPEESEEEDGDSDGDGVEDANEIKWPQTPWSIAIKRIAQFPKLRNAELWMQDECYEWDYAGSSCDQDPEYRQVYQTRFFQALKDATAIDSLTLNNAQDAIITSTGTEEATDALRSRIKSFHIMIATDVCHGSPENKVDQVELHQCFNFLLRTHWLDPFQNQLTHLTLYCDTYWGVYPFTDLRGIHFPCLVSLALGNLSVAHDWQFDWITSHGETLEELILDDVCIVYAMVMPKEMLNANWPNEVPNPDDDTCKHYLTRWDEVFDDFRLDLPKLKRFGMGHGEWHNKMFEARYDLPARIEWTRYMTYYSGIGPSQWTEEFSYHR
ncbi:hypothetical protein P171DRAFT_519995 [Karstenula rhodostoma CBS 690.94]|uniref:F-box domain-containing protein n=1 Tax=Karstenula rhodostoma CBS 690.94 TaxID=1392251 RepID=A0A9P4PP76_9PLEO|nr:hypothetical protein P171DRAFT_519995 [Karstenula rhodostoma CBS 690.94]